MAVTGIGTDIGLGSTGGTGRLGKSAAAAGTGFAEALEKLVDSVEETNAEANTAVTGMINKTVDVHEAMLAVHEAEEKLQLTLAIRNKFVNAYQEIMRMGI